MTCNLHFSLPINGVERLCTLILCSCLYVLPGVCVYLWGRPSSWTFTFNFCTSSSNVWSHWWKPSLLLYTHIRHRFLFPCSLRSALFCVFTQRIVVLLYRRFGTTSLFHLRGSRNPRSNLLPLTHYCNVWRLANWAQCVCVCRGCWYLFIFLYLSLPDVLTSFSASSDRSSLWDIQNIFRICKPFAISILSPVVSESETSYLNSDKSFAERFNTLWDGPAFFFVVVRFWENQRSGIWISRKAVLHVTDENQNWNCCASFCVNYLFQS